MKERKTLKEVYLQHEDAIVIAILVILVIALFIGGYFFSWNFMEKPLNDSQLELCEQVARDVYAQKGNVIVEEPEDFSISITATTITVRSANILSSGKVIAKLQNGELVMKRDMETGKVVFGNILTGILFILAAWLLFAAAIKIYEKIEEKSGK